MALFDFLKKFSSSQSSSLIPNGTSMINSMQFRENPQIVNLIIPDSVTIIGSNAFAKCPNLISAVIPGGVSVIENNAFGDCVNLGNVIIKESMGFNMMTINSSAFYNCTSLTTVRLSHSVSNIMDFAFYNCRSLTSLTIPSSVRYIGYRAFGDTALEMSYLRVFGDYGDVHLNTDITLRAMF